MTASIDIRIKPPKVRPKMAAVPRVDIAGHSAIGRSKKRNEDQYLIARVNHGLNIAEASISIHGGEDLATAETLMIVADGVGGHADGHIASKTATRVIAEVLTQGLAKRKPRTDGAGAHAVYRAISKAHDALAAKVKYDEADPSLATTATVALIEWPYLVIGHVGDSRCYVLRDGELKQLTTDHTAAEGLRARGIDPPAHFENVLTQAVGAAEVARADTRRVHLRAGDQVLLTSDGVSKFVSERRMIELLGSASDAKTAARELVLAAQDAGTDDDATAVVAQVRFARARNRRRATPND